MNSVTVRQNEDRQLRRLLAQRRLYSRAKLLLGIQTALVVPGAIAWSLVVIWQPHLKVFAGLWGALVTLADQVLFTPWQQSLKDRAARIQEQFDCDVLEMEWQDITVGARPSAEVVTEFGTLKEGESFEGHRLVDWYPKEIEPLSIEQARAICQRTNCWWDSRLRRKYAAWSIGVVVALLVAAIFLGVGKSIPLDAFVVGVFLPFLPLMILGFRQFNEQRQAADRLDKLRQHIEKQWDQLISDKASKEALAESARRVQDELFDHRKRNPVVFDWVYNLLRDEQEEIMHRNAQDLVREVTARS